MNTAGKLWIGLGTLCIILVLACLAIYSAGSGPAELRYTDRFVLVLVLTLAVTGALVAGVTGALVARDLVSLEAALRDNREMLRVTLASIGDAVIATDAEGRITLLNAVAEALTGWSQAQAVGVSLEQVFRIIHEQTNATMDNPALRVMREGRVVGLANHAVLVSKADKRLHIEDSAAPIRDARGRICGVVIVFRDVSTRRETEKRAQAERAIGKNARSNLTGEIAAPQAQVRDQRVPTALRVQQDAAAESANLGAAQLMPAQRILVVDDNRDAAASLVMLLNLSGNTTYLAHDGLEAFAQARALLPHIILLDIGLPKLNGFEVARKIRAEAWGASMILIALTGWGTEQDRQKSRNSGFDEHLVKPVDYATLTRCLQELFAERAR